MASSSSFSPFNYTYTFDVFLSFRGEDTRVGFTGHLYNALSQRGVLTFIDDHGLRKGEEITPALVKAIKDSRMAIIIFSKDYASSTFCLNELAQIVECKNEKGDWFWPIFYDVLPAQVRYQTGTYREALDKHERGKFKNDKGKVANWRKALRIAADLSGKHFEIQGREKEYLFINKIVDEVSAELNRLPLHIAEFPVGLQARLRDVQSLLDTNSGNKVIMLGIYGMGGIGKSTLARAIYNLIVDQFPQGSCFIEKVRVESTWPCLELIQRTMLDKLVGERNIQLGGPHEGMSLLKERLRRKKVLVILDDVDSKEQLDATAGGLDWFGSGSIIIITSRDKRLLISHCVEKLHEVNELNDTEARELFKWHAFKTKETDPSSEEIIKRATDYAGGLPLALKRIGSNLFLKDADAWESELKAYETIPNTEVQKSLEVSYDALQEREKDIFLDIACFFKGCTERYVTSMLHACGFQAKSGIEELKYKSLIKILTSDTNYDEDNVLTMHDLIQYMGKEIVRQQSIKRPEKRNRLWFHEDIILILKKVKENDIIEAIMLDMPEDRVANWNQEVFGKMENLRMLLIKNGCNVGIPNLPDSLRVLEWWGYPSPSFLFDSLMENLIILNLSQSHFKWDTPLEQTKSLSHLILRGCEFITEIPDVSSSPNLRELCVDDCTNLISIHDSVGSSLVKLERFSAKGCTKLTKVPHEIKLPSLEYLCLRDCSNVAIFPKIEGPMEKLQFVDFEGTTIENLPLPVENLKGLQSLSLSRCTKLSIDVLANMVQNMLSDFPSLKKLRLEGSNLTMIPESFGECHLLRDLSVKDSKKLKKIRGLPQDITSMNALNCHSLNIHTAPTNMVLKQIFEYDCTIKRTFWLAGKRLPQWFTMYRRGNSLGFLFRKRIPDMTVGLVARGANKRYDYCFKINNSSEISCSNFFSHSGSKKEEIFISNDLRAIVSSRSTMPLLDEWNYAEFSFTQSSNSYHLLIEPVRWSGVHVNRESMEDIQFLDMTPGDSSQAHGFALEQNLQAQSPALSSGEVNGESSRNQNVSEDEMETFYDCLEDEEAREVLKKVRDLISNDASIFMHPEKCSDMKDSLDYLSNLLSENDHGISREMITLISDASREFTHWSNDYTEANMKIECITPELMRVDLLQAALKDNMKQYRDVVALENAHQRKRDIFEEGKMIKTQRDELRKKIPHLQHEHCLAKEKQTRIRHAWLKLGENFNKIFID